MSFRIYHQPFSQLGRITPAVDSVGRGVDSIGRGVDSIGRGVDSVGHGGGGSPQLFRDVHLYDYSYREEKYTPLVNEGQREWIEKLLPRMSNPTAIQGLQIILANIGTLNNFDNTNQKRAEDLLADLSYVIHTRDTDLLPLLEEQLADMYQLGQCAQGRVTRLWQLRQLVE